MELTDDEMREKLATALYEAGVHTDADDDRIFCEQVADYLLPMVIQWVDGG